ncbi:MAG: butyrate kinase [Bacillota bacterium]
MKNTLLLIINPGSTSTKIAVFRGEQPEYNETLRHTAEELGRFAGTIDQLDFRRQLVLEAVRKAGIDLNKIKAVIGRGGLLRPIPGGTYIVNERMLADLKAEERGTHASNLGGLIAHQIAAEIGVNAYIVDPVCVDEMEPLARISGMPENPRESLFHALNQKAIARRTASDLGKAYHELNLIIVHLGGGISVGAHRRGRVIDVNNAIPGDGPFSPERSGGVPAGRLVDMCYSGEFSREEMKKKLVGKGGLVAYLGTNDAVEVENRIARGDADAELVYEAMAYQVAREVGACAAVLKGHVDAVVITGGIAHSSILVDWITERVEFIAPVKVYPGEDEMAALAEGGLRVLTGLEPAKEY